MNGIALSEDDVPPQKVEGSVIVCAYFAITCAAVMSVTLNVYHDLHRPGNGGHPPLGFSALPAPIAVMTGVVVPLLCVLISHVAATIPTGNWVKAWLFTLTGVLMYVSATAGTKTLAGVMGLAPALAVSIGVDATAMTFLGVLMLAMARKSALAAWRAGESERQRLAAVAAVAARHGRPAVRETPGGNMPAVAGGNAPGNTLEGNTAALAEGSTGGAAAPDGLVLATGETPAGGQGSGLASVSPIRRQAATDDEIRLLAGDLADKLEAAGKKLSVRAYIYGEGCAGVPGLPDDFKGYGGKTARVSPVIAEVKAARDAAAGTSGGAAGAR